MGIPFPLCVNFTGEEAPIHLSVFFPSSHLGQLSVDQCSSPGAPPAVHTQPRGSCWDQEQPC